MLSPSGAVLSELPPEAFRIVEAGESRPVSEVEAVGAGWRTVLYFDQLLSEPRVLRHAAEALSARSRELTDLGSVEVVAAGWDSERGLEATRDAVELADFLSWMRVREVEEEGQTAIRARFTDRLLDAVARWQAASGTPAGGGIEAPRPEEPRPEESSAEEPLTEELGAGDPDGEDSGQEAEAEPVPQSPGIEWLATEPAAEERQAATDRPREDPEIDGPDRKTSILEQLRADLQVAIEEEAALLREHHERLVSWVADHPSTEPKLLVLVSGGFDADSESFYRQLLADTPFTGLEKTAVFPTVEPSVDDLGKTLSVYGWMTVPYAALRWEVPDAARPEAEVETVYQDGQLVDRVMLPSIDALKIWRRKRDSREEASAEPPPPLQLDPLGALRRLAELTGGEVASDAVALAGVLERLPSRRRLRYSSSLLPTVYEAMEIGVEVGGGAAGLEALVRYPRWVGQFEPEVVSRVRVRRYVHDGLDEGELPVDAVFRSPAGAERGDLAIQIDGDPSAAGGRAIQAPWRLTVAREQGAGVVELLHQETLGSAIVDLTLGAPEGSVIHELELWLAPARGMAEAPLAVLVEELGTGRWGATYASTMASLGRGTDPRTGRSYLLPAPQLIHLLAPREALVMGSVVFETVVSEEGVARVDFLIDGELEASSGSPPFSAILDLGPFPQTRRIEVVAFDDRNGELGRDNLMVNEGGGNLRVRIIEPEPPEAGILQRPLVGPVEVEAEVLGSRDLMVERVEFYWNDELTATRYAPPFRQQVVVPEDDLLGFLRVVAHLEDGTVAEDVVLLNTPGQSERLEVDLVELYVVVTDRQGRPVRGLERDQFRLFEEREEMEISTFGDAGDLPLTVGLAIDSSASMFVKLPEVGAVAMEFVQGLRPRRDRAFIVGFGGEPQLLRSMTSDLAAVERAFSRLESNGQTAIWQAVVYSLVQLQSVPGKKALIVYTDGADEDADFPYRLAQRFARQVGVPIYVILSNNEIVRTQGKGLSVRPFLNRLDSLVESVGGKVFVTRVGEDLRAVYREIDEELRSQYVVGYYAEDLGGDEWRRLEVEVKPSGMKARTIAGFYR